MSKNNSKNQSGIAPGNPDAYRNLFEQSLELLKKKYVPSERVLDLINEYTGKISKNHDYGHDSEFSMKVKSSLLLAALENIMAVQQSVQDELIKVKKGYEEVLSLITHEFKNLLTTAHGYNNLLQKQLNQEKRSDLLTIQKSIERIIIKLFRMIDALLKMSLSEKHILMPDLRLIDIDKDIISTLESELSTDLSSKTMQIKKKIKSNRTMILADEQLIEIVMRNLLENAVKYGEQNTDIEIVVENTAKDLIVSIKNYGSYIPDNICDGIFEKFKTVKLGTINEGTGIGLYNVKNLLRIHNGDITCTSATGNWIKFVIKIPFET